MKLTQEEYAAIVRREIEEAQGYDTDALASKRANALDLYHGKMSDPGDGRSDSVSFDVADVVHSLMAQIMPMFTSSLIEFEPFGEEDEPQAQMESDFVRWALERNNGFKTLYGSAFDALLQGNGWIKIDIDETPIVVTDTFPELDVYARVMIEDSLKPNQTVEFKDVKKGVQVTKTTTERKLRVRSISPDVMLFSSAWDQFEFQELRFVGERVLYTESDLKAMGIPQHVIESLPDATEDYWPAIMAREGIYQDYNSNRNRANQDAEQLKECFDCHIRVDLEQNGVSELRRVLIAGNEILMEEAADFIPYATGSPVPMPHRVQGQGMAEIMGQIQKVKTNLQRSLEDALEINALGRYEAVEGKVNLDDLTDGRTTGVIRTRAPGMVTPIALSQAPQDTIMGLQYLDTVREQRGGASLDLNDSDRQLMASSATAAAGVQGNHERQAGWYCHNLVSTLLTETFRLIHETMRLQWPEPVGAKIRGKWQQTNPAEWPKRQYLSVTAGLTSMERTQKTAALSALLMQQQQWYAGGYNGIIVDAGKIYQTAADWIRSADVGNPDEYLVDPDSEEARQAAQQQAQQQQAQQEKMEDIQYLLMQQQAQLEQQKMELDKYKHDSELRFKYYDSNLDADVKEAEMTADALVKLDPGPERANGSADL